MSSEGTTEDIENGTICLGTDGCGLNWMLIVTGAERGNIWQTADVGITSLIPSRSFLGWYEEWLDGRREWFE